MSFAETLEMGVAGESAVANWLKWSWDFAVLPVYEKIVDKGKGPQLFTPRESLVAPDLLVYKGAKVWWIEAKHKSAFAWNYTRGIWTTGIDLRHYRDYCKVDDGSPWPVWLLFLHEGEKARDDPPRGVVPRHTRPMDGSPAGLFGNPLSYLREHVNHKSEKHGRSGMVYWSKDDLRELATLEQVRAAQAAMLN